MRISRIALTAALLVGGLGGGAAMAESGLRFGTSPQITVGPATPLIAYHVTCMMGSGDVMANVLLRNAGAAAVPAGTAIHWQVSGGTGGTYHVGRGGLAPGEVVMVGGAPYPFTCTASL